MSKTLAVQECYIIEGVAGEIFLRALLVNNPRGATYKVIKI